MEEFLMTTHGQALPPEKDFDHYPGGFFHPAIPERAPTPPLPETDDNVEDHDAADDVVGDNDFLPRAAPAA